MFFKNPEHLKLFYETAGDPKDPAVLFIHGLGADHRMWRPQKGFFVRAGYFVVQPDLRSHGQSETGAFSIVACAGDLNMLLGELQIQKAHLIGVSMGGLIVQQMACDFPDCADKIVICDSFSGVTSFIERFNAKLAALLLAVLPNKLLTKVLVSTYQRLGRDDVADYFADILSVADVHSLRQIRKAVNDFNLIARLPEIQQPALVLVGDQFGKMAVEMARKTAVGLPSAAFQILAGGGDPSNMLVPEEFNQQVMAFLAE